MMVGAQVRLVFFLKKILPSMVSMILMLVFSHDQLVMIADRLIKEADKEEKNRVNFLEFQEAVDEVDIEGKMAFISFY